MKASIHRPTRIKVDLPAILANIQQVMTRLPKQAKIFSVVKANAYGHGVEAVAPFLENAVDGFCVSNFDEALELRQLGIQKDILVLGAVPPQVVQQAIQENIILTLLTKEWLQEVQLADGLKVHIKVDSGMGRVGFRSSQEIDEVMAIAAEKGMVVEGIFTHFATADQQDQMQFNQQVAQFNKILSSLQYVPEMIHASNSATSIWHPDTVFNMVRLGDIQFGLNPSGRELELPFSPRPALSLSSELIQVKRLEKGAFIGYGGTYQTTQDEVIGTVPIGYADGLTRDMQGFHVLVDGQVCPIVGRVSMDQMTILLPKKYPINTKVTLIGQDMQEEITVQDWADYRGTINYEIVCLLSDRIPRIYKP
ncbi:alanine racemase [Streptococcus cameli]